MTLCIDEKKPENRYKIIGRCYKGKKTYWLWLDSRYCSSGNAHLAVRFNDTWNNTVGMEPGWMKQGRYVKTLSSWTTALVALEERKRG